MFRFVPFKLNMCTCNDFKIPVLSTRYELYRLLADGRVPDYGLGGNRRHVARGKRVFTGDKFKNSVSATRTHGRYHRVYGKQHLPRLAVWVPRGGRPDKSNVCTLVRCTMETPRERSHLSLQAGRASFGPAVCNGRRRGTANYSRNFSRQNATRDYYDPITLVERAWEKGIDNRGSHVGRRYSLPLIVRVISPFLYA